jgi:hypothetical protein
MSGSDDSIETSRSRRTFGRAVLLGAPIVAAGVLLNEQAASANTGDPWLAGGNASASTDTLGTTTTQPLVIVTGGVERMRIDGTDGRIGIGIATPSALTQLHVRSATKNFTARFDNSATNGVCVIGNATGPNGRGVTANASGTSGSAVAGYGLAPGTDVTGVYGETQTVNGRGVRGVATTTGGEGVRGESALGYGVHGIASSNSAVFTFGVFGEHTGTSGIGVAGIGTTGVKGFSTSGFGVNGEGLTGVSGLGSEYGVEAFASGAGGVALRAVALSPATLAAKFTGDVNVAGTLSKSAGTFRIDHPQDPANKYLVHSFVESPEMKNVYDGVVFCDMNGEAVVEMPSYFEALNRTFRYQLTPIGASAPNLFIADKVADGRFRIAGGLAGL